MKKTNNNNISDDSIMTLLKNRISYLDDKIWNEKYGGGNIDAEALLIHLLNREIWIETAHKSALVQELKKLNNQNHEHKKTKN
jgi:hypothetical protein